MTCYARHIAYLMGAAVLATVSWGAGQSASGEDVWLARSTRSLSDDGGLQILPVSSSEPAQHEPAQKASFRLSDHGMKSFYPRVPGEMLREFRDTTLHDATVPAPPADPHTQPGLLRALPPIEPAPAEPGPSDAPMPVQRAASGSCDTCGTSAIACECSHRGADEGLFQHTQVFLAGDGWKNIFDDDDNSNFGFRSGFNLGVDLPGDRGVRGQIGMSYGAYDLGGREGLLSRDDPIEQQVFATAGLYKRSVVECGDRWAWGTVYDILMADEAGERADSLRLAQIRSSVGYAINESDEFGVWTAFRLLKDYAPAQRVMVNVTDQANLFWHHRWQFGGDTTTYVGWADDPGSVVVGLDGRVPLSHRAALFGRLQYIIPSTRRGDIHPTLGIDDVFTQEAWNVSFGIMFYRGAKAVSPTVSGVFGLPLLDVADNGTFSYQASNL